MNKQSARGARRRWPWFFATVAALVISCISVLLAFTSQYDLNSLKPFITRIVKERTGHDLLIHGQIEFDMDLTPSLTVEKVVLQNASRGTLPEIAKAERVEVELALLPLLRKKIEIKKVILREPNFVLETDRSGRGNVCVLNNGGLPPTGETEVPDLSFGEIDVERGVFIYKDGKTGRSVSITVHHLKAKSTRNGDRIELDMRGTYASKRFELKGWVGSMASLMAPEEPWPLDVRVRAFETELRLNGSIRSFRSAEGLALKVRGAGNSFKGIEDAFGLGRIPEVGPFKIQCDLCGKKEKTFRLSNLTFRSKAGEGRGDLQLDLSGSSPDLRGSLVWEKLDVASFISKKDAPVKATKIFPSEPLPFEYLGKMNGDLDLTVNKVVLPHTVIEALQTRLHATERLFLAKPLHFKGGGGQGSGVLQVQKEGTTLKVAAQAKVNQVDLNLLLERRSAQGKAEAEIDVTAQGVSIADLMGNLDGFVLVAVSGFRVENKYLNLMGSDFVTSLSQIFTPAEATATEINCLVSGFRITNGLAQVTAMVADTNDMVATGGGRMNLKEEQLDLTISPRPKKGLAGLSFSLSEVTRSFKLGGTFVEPSLNIDPLHTALTIGKAVGGVFLMGPAGAALAFAGQTAGEEDVCMAAMEAAREGGKAREEKREERQRSEGDQGAGKERATAHSIGESVGRLFKKMSSQPATPVDIYGGGP